MADSVIELRNVRKTFALPGGGVVPVLDIDSFTMATGAQCALEG